MKEIVKYKIINDTLYYRVKKYFYCDQIISEFSKK